jgi:hypothetical protein
MATFVPGLTDYIPQFQNDIPDLGLIQQTLKIKQSQYDANYAKIKSIQDTILNSPLTRDDTKETRKAFFEAANKAIKQISTVDLSKAQNISVAERIFDPLLNNQLFKKDAAVTKIIMSEAEKGQAAKDCADPKKCNDAYNPESDEALNYWLENFKNMTPEEALNATPKRYVYDPKISKKLTDLIKEIEPSATVTEVQGQWIVKTKMGDQVQAELNSILHNAIASDPQVQEYMQNKAFVQRERFIRSSDLPRKQADSQYNQDILASIETNLTKELANINEAIDQIDIEGKRLIDSFGGKIPKGDPVIQRIEQYAALKKILEGNRDTYLDRQESLKTFRENPSSARIDNDIASSLLSNQISSFARSYSALKKEVDIKANPYAVNQDKFNYDVALQKIRDQNEKENIRLRAEMDMAKKQFEFNLENAGSVFGEGNAGFPGSDGLTLIPQGTGATRPIDAVAKHNTDQAIIYADKAANQKKEYLLRLYDNIDEAEKNKLFKKSDGTVYTFEELKDLDPKTLETTKNGKASTLGILYGKIKRITSNTPSKNLAKAQGELAALQTSIELNERVAKEALDAYYSNNKKVNTNLRKNPEFVELMKTIMQGNDPELKKLFSIKDGKIDVDRNALFELIRNERDPALAKAARTGRVASAPGYSYYNLKVSERLELLENLEKIVSDVTSTTYSSSSTQPKIVGADLTMDQLGNYQISYPSIGFTTTVNSTDKTPAKATTLSLLNNLDIVNTAEPNAKMTFYDSNLNKITTGDDVIAQLKAGFSYPQKNNPMQINSIIRSENLNHENEFDDTKVKYKISIAPSTAEAIAKNIGGDAKASDYTELTVVVDKAADRSNFKNASDNANAANTILRGGGKISIPISNPVNGDKYELHYLMGEDKQIYQYLEYNGIYQNGSYIPIGNGDPNVKIQKDVSSVKTKIAEDINTKANNNQKLQADFVPANDLYNLLGLK